MRNELNVVLLKFHWYAIDYMEIVFANLKVRLPIFVSFLICSHSALQYMQNFVTTECCINGINMTLSPDLRLSKLFV